MYASGTEVADEAGHSLAIQDPGRAWYLARLQLLRDIAHDVELLGQEGDEKGKTAGELAARFKKILDINAESEWEAYIKHAASRAPDLAEALRRSGQPVSVSMVDYPAQRLRLPTARWAELPVEGGGMWFCLGDGTEQGFPIPPLFPPQPKPDPSDDLLLIDLTDRRHLATAALHEILEQFRATAVSIMTPCEPVGAWRRLRYLSQHYRQVYLLGLSELSADELSGWDKDEVEVFPLSHAAQRVSQLASTAMAVRLLALGSATAALAEWIREADARRPEARVSAQAVVLERLDSWIKTFELTLKAFNDAILYERKLVPEEWSVRVLQRPYPGTVPAILAERVQA